MFECGHDIHELMPCAPTPMYARESSVRARDRLEIQRHSIPRAPRFRPRPVLAAGRRSGRGAEMETGALAATMLGFALIFGVIVPRAPIVGAALTVLGPLCPMPQLLCDALDLSACGPVLTLEVDPVYEGKHGPIKYYLFLLWLAIPIGMQQSKQRGELFDLHGQMVFYKSYHSDRINVAIHALCIPIILWTALGLCAMTAPMLTGAPSWMDWSLFPAFLYSSYYLQMAQPASPLVACVASASVLLGWTVHHTPSISPSIDTLIWLHVGGWIAQFWGHGVHERRESTLSTPRSNGVCCAGPLKMLSACSLV